MSIVLAAIGLVSLVVVVAVVWVLTLRRVVDTNSVHIIQSAKETVSYGKDEKSGNTYYQWPSWMPVIGINVIVLPVSVFSLRLENYEAYDNGRLPFVLDLEAFFRISDSNIAAQRVTDVRNLNSQLTSILQGAARTILASKTIEEIMGGRSEFGEAFTVEVDEQLKAWGVTTVKNIELMDIRDTSKSSVIFNIMEKKKSEIEKDSRLVVAENFKIAENAEIDAAREVNINKQLAEQQVGIRTAEKEQQVGIAKEKSAQEIKSQQLVTTERELEIVRVSNVKSAEIEKDVNIVKAEETKRTEIVRAEGDKERIRLIAEANLITAQLAADGLLANGKATAESETLLQLAPVEAQITLAREIGENAAYQKYLIDLRGIEANEAVGIEQAKALEKSDIKIISNAGTPSAGLNGVGKMFSSSLGTDMGATLEGLAQSEVGKKLLANFIGKSE